MQKPAVPTSVTIDPGKLRDIVSEALRKPTHEACMRFFIVQLSGALLDTDPEMADAVGSLIDIIPSKITIHDLSALTNRVAP